MTKKLGETKSKQQTERAWRHGKKCGCPDCLHKRLRAWDDRVAEMFKPRMPSDAIQCIPVRGHFRRSKKYLKKDPAFRSLVMERIKSLIQDGDE
jgi:hypothetical protein